MQSVRTAGQKRLAGEMSALGATSVRYLFGLPFALAWLWFLLAQEGGGLPAPSPVFLIYGLLASLLQILATILLVRLFTLRNFAVGSCYVRTEVLITALLGLALFGEAVSGLGWLAMCACVAGLILLTIARSGQTSDLWNLSALYGLGAGVAFALTSLLIRQASLSFGLDDALLAAALTLAYMVVVQTFISVALLCLRRAAELKVIFQKWRLSLFVGVTSVIGSAGWFTAFTLERAAYVKTLGQIEFLLTLAISVFYFREAPSRVELLAMLILLGGVVLLLLAP